MRRSRIAVYVHLVWATQDRRPLLAPKWEREFYRHVAQVARSLGCGVEAIGGMADHIHIVLSLSATASLAEIVETLQQSSSRFVREHLQPREEVRWDGCYGALSISRWELPQVVNYVSSQKKHHRSEMLWPELEITFEHAGPAQ